MRMFWIKLQRSVGFSALFLTVSILLPGIALAFPQPIGFLNLDVCMDENPQLGETHQQAKPMGFGPAAIGPGLIKWTLLTYTPFFPLDLWACAQTTKLSGIADDIYCFDQAGGIHSYMAEGLVPFRLNATSINDTVLQLDGINVDEGQRVDFYFGMTPAGQSILPLGSGNATIWHAEWTKGSNEQGVCYDNNSCTGTRISSGTTKCACKTAGGGSWQAKGPPVGPCQAL